MKLVLTLWISILVAHSTSVQAMDPKDEMRFIKELSATNCWAGLSQETDSGDVYPINGTIIETPLIVDSKNRTLATIHSSDGTVTVSANGSCNRTSETSATYMARRIQAISAELSAYRRKDNGSYELILSSGDAQGRNRSSRSMNETLFNELKAKRLELFKSCAEAKGAIGEAARKAITAMSGQGEKADKPANATN